jgi:hypothetical protein
MVSISDSLTVENAGTYYYYSVTKIGHQDLLVNGDSRGNAAGRAAGAGRG